MAINGSIQVGELRKVNEIEAALLGNLGMAPAYEALEQGQGHELLPEPRPAWRERLSDLFGSWWATLAIFVALLAAILVLMWLLVPKPDGGGKVGAGMLFTCALLPQSSFFGLLPASWPPLACTATAADGECESYRLQTGEACC